MATDESHIRRAIEIPCEEVIDRADGSTIVEGPVLEREGLAVHEDYFSTPS